MRQRHIQETIPHLTREMNLLVREILFWFILHEDILSLCLYLHRLSFAHPFHRLISLEFLDTS